MSALIGFRGSDGFPSWRFSALGLRATGGFLSRLGLSGIVNMSKLQGVASRNSKGSVSLLDTRRGGSGASIPWEFFLVCPPFSSPELEEIEDASCKIIAGALSERSFLGTGLGGGVGSGSTLRVRDTGEPRGVCVLLGPLLGNACLGRLAYSGVRPGLWPRFKCRGGLSRGRGGSGGSMSGLRGGSCGRSSIGGGGRGRLSTAALEGAGVEES